jgi:hypothetical protein
MDTKETQILNTKSIILCDCPMCGLEHKVKMIWIGRGRPKKYCSRCNGIAKNIGGNVFILD